MLLTDLFIKKCLFHRNLFVSDTIQVVDQLNTRPPQGNALKRLTCVSTISMSSSLPIKGLRFSPGIESRWYR